MGRSIKHTNDDQAWFVWSVDTVVEKNFYIVCFFFCCFSSLVHDGLCVGLSVYSVRRF